MTSPVVPYADLAAQHRPLKDALLAAVADVLAHSQFILGPEVADFEARFAELCGIPHAIGINSGTDALLLALRALGIQSGDEVITVPNSFVASTTCICLLGARPVFVDVRSDLNLDPSKLAAAITPRTRAILPVHLAGRPCAMDEILAIADRHGIPVVEDCAQAILAAYRDKHVGTLGRIGCFSLHPQKTLGACGDGGVLTTSDPTLAEELRSMRNIGMRGKGDCVSWGQNSRLDTIQAAMLLVKLPYLAEWTTRRIENAGYYQQALAGLPDCVLPTDGPFEFAVYNTFRILSPRRDELRAYLAECGIGTAVHYRVPIHRMTVGQKLGYAEGSLPVAEKQAAETLSLPNYPELSSEQLAFVCEKIRAFFRC